MTVKEFYAEIEGDYDEVMSRLLTEDRVCKYVCKFADNTDYAQLEEALANSDWDLLFRSSHSIKGMCANLAFTRLFSSGSALCETVRHGAPEVDIQPLVDAFESDYAKMIATIEKFKAEKE